MANEKEKVNTKLQFSGNAQKTRFIELVAKYNEQEPKLRKNIRTDMGTTYISPQGAEVILYALEEITGTPHPEPKRRPAQTNGETPSEDGDKEAAAE